MNINYKPAYKLIACMILISIFLQSCNNFSNQLPPREEECMGARLETLETTNQLAINHLVNQECAVEGGCLVNFYEKIGGMMEGDDQQEENKKIRLEKLREDIVEVDLSEFPVKLHDKNLNLVQILGNRTQ